MIRTAVVFKDKEFSAAVSDALAAAHAGIIPVGSPEADFDILITDDEEAAAVCEKGTVVIEKPFRTGELIYMIIVEYGRLYGRLPLLPYGMEGKSRTVLFMSAAGGTGSSSAAVGLCEELHRYRGQEVCYVSLETIGNEKKRFCDGEGERFFYFLEKTGYAERLPREVFLRDMFGISAVPTGGRVNELLFKDAEDFARAINVICSSGFDYVVFDAGGVLNENVLSLAEKADKVFFIQRAGEGERTERLISHLEEKIDDIRARAAIIENFARIEESECKNEVGRIFLEYDEASLKQGVAIDGAFGLGVKEIADLLYL